MVTLQQSTAPRARNFYPDARSTIATRADLKCATQQLCPALHTSKTLTLTGDRTVKPDSVIEYIEYQIRILNCKVDLDM